MERIQVKEVIAEDVDSRVFNLYEKREKIYIRSMEGIFQKIRTYTGWPLLLGYFLLPWLQIEGRQAMLFDLPERQFHILWLTLWPQDLVLLIWTLVIAAIALFFVTTLWGRVWCGYTCPQTVWTAIFSWAEQVAEGERHQRIKLDQTPSLFSRNGRNRAGWNKVWRRTLKHVMWLGFAALTGVTFVAYFYGIREFLYDSWHLQLPLTAVAWSVFFTLATYINAGWMREQVCIYMCPYARFQSAMFDKDTLIISYDPARGETRGARRKGSDYKAQDLGDCIDCTMCVQVCPTGIDIRDGLQYECIGCAACIDACDSVMEKMEYPKGLISYTTENKLAGGTWTWRRPKLLAYGLALALMLALFSATIVIRTPLRLDATRDRSQLYQEVPGGLIENVYTIKATNMTNSPRQFRLNLTGMSNAEILPDTIIDVPERTAREQIIRVRANPDELSSFNTTFYFTLESIDSEEGGASLQTRTESRFFGPQPLGNRP